MEDISRIWPGWELTRVLGSGAHGTVYLARNSSGSATNLAVVKVIAVPPSDERIRSARESGVSDDDLRAYLRRFQDDLAWELTLYKTEASPGLGTLEAFTFEDDEATPGWIGYIRAPVYTTLEERYGGRPSYQETMRLLYGVGTALRSCEARAAVHGGVRPSNVMITETGDFVLCDFAVNRCLGKVGRGVFGGLSEFDAPETERGDFSHASDVYSLGMLGKTFLGNDAPPAVLRVLNRAASEKPEDRYTSAAEFMAALRQAETEPDDVREPEEPAVVFADPNAIVPGSGT